MNIRSSLYWKKLIYADPLALARKLAKSPRLWLFLDYDGTLADFAPTPDTLIPDPELIDLLKGLASLPNLRIAVISGRRLSHMQTLLPVPGIWIAGTYGADLLTPDGCLIHRLDLDEVRPTLDLLKPLWTNLLAGKDGFYLEDKDWSLALHARFASPEQAESVMSAARKLIPQPLPETLHVLDGNRFLEVAPAQIDKARTVDWILSENPWPAATLVYAGDDDKDELAFELVQKKGGVTVSVTAELAHTDYCLSSPSQARRWLSELARIRR